MTRPTTRTVSYAGLRAASAGASRAARGSSRKRNTQPELVLRLALRRQGVGGYRIDAADLPGKPDIVFRRCKVAVFCDGDFWHGRNLAKRLSMLEVGHNASYWTSKVRGNVERDRRSDRELAASGWLVLRFWETDIKRDPDTIAAWIRAVLLERETGT